jgi:dTMP kinase
VKGFFIVFEGVDGSGKTTQAKLLYEHLKDQGCEVKSVEEPGGTDVGELIRQITLSSQSRLEPLTELFLYEASRHELTYRVIRPALERGEIVLCQRYSYSSLAYQGYGRGLALEWVGKLNEWATGGLKPDIAFFLDVPAEEGLRRLGKARQPDRIECEGLEFLRRVEEGYRTIAKESPEVVVLDGTRGPKQVFGEILRTLAEMKGGEGGIHLR